MTAELFIRTWKPDLSWLSYCLAFLKKNWAEPGKIKVIANRDCELDCQKWYDIADFFYVDPWPDTHEFKCYCALLPETLSVADLIINIDSDHMLVEKTCLEDFLYQGKPIIYYREHAEMGDFLGIRLWTPAVTHWIGETPTRSYMICTPFVFWRKTIAGLRQLIELRSQCHFRDALYSDVPFHVETFIQHPKRFPDWEVLGFYAQTHEPDLYHFQDPGEFTPGYPKAGRWRTYHSWTQWNPQTIAELDRLLAS